MRIERSKGLNGEIFVSGDKSISHRSVLLGAIAEGETWVEGFLMGEDCLSTIDCFRKMGIEIETWKDNKVRIAGKGLRGLKKPVELLYTGNSGTTTRLLSGLLAAQDFDCIIDGDDSIKKRPMDRVITPLAQMGAEITAVSGRFCPLQIFGKKLTGMEYTMPVASAQLKSAILLAGLYADSKTTITEPQASRNHTELMLKSMGVKIVKEKNKITIFPTERLCAEKIKVPGDISSAAYFMVAGLIVPHSEVVIKQVGINPTRTGIIEVLQNMGGSVLVQNRRMFGGEEVADILVKSSALKGTVIEGDVIPRLIDEIPVLAVAAAVADGETIIRDAGELKVKESNRIDVMVNLLKQAGCDIEPTEDGMVINGGELAGGCFESYNDHRIAMSMAVAGLVSSKATQIKNDGCIAISFPEFWKKLNSLN